MRKNSKPPQRDKATAAEVEQQIVELSKRIEFYLTEYSIEMLAQKVKSGEFVVPKYQREYTWEDRRKSRFIESLIIGLPIPFLFFWEMPDGKLEIVDGSQRLRAIEEFVLGSFRLGDLESLTKLSGFTFEELPESRRRKINNRSIRGVILNEHADEQARFDLFDRINTGSKIANPAEVRRGALSGPFMDLLTELSKNERFTKLAPFPKKATDARQHEELVARFFAYSNGLTDYKDRPSEYIFNYVKRMNDVVVNNSQILEDLRSDFLSVIKFVEECFPYGFRKSPAGKVTYKARFEAISIGCKFALKVKPSLSSANVNDVKIWLNSKEFDKVTGSDGANSIARLTGRIDFVRRKLLGI